MTEHTSIPQFLKAMDALRRMNNMGDPSWRFFSVEGLMLHYGRSFTPAPLPAEVRRGAKRDCFKNAIQATAWGAKGDYVYVEGQAISMIPTGHAWLTDRAGELAFDPTWDDGTEYFGIAFDPNWAAQTMVDTGVYGIFGGENQKLILGLLKDGLPHEALAFPEDDRPDANADADADADAG